METARSCHNNTRYRSVKYQLPILSPERAFFISSNFATLHFVRGSQEMLCAVFFPNRSLTTVLALSRKAQANEDHLLQRMLQERPTRARLKSRSPVSQQAHHLSDLAPPGMTKQSWLRTRWKDDWLAAPPSRLHNFIRDPHSVPGLDLPRLASKAVDNPQPPSHGCRPVQLVHAEVGPQGLLCL